jgi:hypothetical protein
MGNLLFVAVEELLDIDVFELGLCKLTTCFLSLLPLFASLLQQILLLV